MADMWVFCYITSNSVYPLSIIIMGEMDSYYEENNLDSLLSGSISVGFETVFLRRFDVKNPFGIAVGYPFSFYIGNQARIL